MQKRFTLINLGGWLSMLAVNYIIYSVTPVGSHSTLGASIFALATGIGLIAAFLVKVSPPPSKKALVATMLSSTLLVWFGVMIGLTCIYASPDNVSRALPCAIFFLGGGFVAAGMNIYSIKTNAAKKWFGARSFSLLVSFLYILAGIQLISTLLFTCPTERMETVSAMVVAVSIILVFSAICRLITFTPDPGKAAPSGRRASAPSIITMPTALRVTLCLVLLANIFEALLSLFLKVQIYSFRPLSTSHSTPNTAFIYLTSSTVLILFLIHLYGVFRQREWAVKGTLMMFMAIALSGVLSYLSIKYMSSNSHYYTYYIPALRKGGLTAFFWTTNIVLNSITALIAGLSLKNQFRQNRMENHEAKRLA
jgi:hypothetical protein